MASQSPCEGDMTLLIACNITARYLLHGSTANKQCIGKLIEPSSWPAAFKRMGKAMKQEYSRIERKHRLRKVSLSKIRACDTILTRAYDSDPEVVELLSARDALVLVMYCCKIFRTTAYCALTLLHSAMLQVFVRVTVPARRQHAL
jgi:hypothetical protein